MDRQVKILGIVLLLLAVVAGVGFADDSVRVRVACTIPAIPGVNAPLLQQETRSTKKSETANVEPKTELDAQDGQELKNQDKEKQDNEQLESTEEKPTVLVKTLYSR